VGAVVGGPDEMDKFKDVRKEYKFTEIALDYNTGLVAGISAVLTFPPEFWATDCSKEVPFYKFTKAPKNGSNFTTSARVRGADPNKGLDIDPATADAAGIWYDPDSDYSKAVGNDPLL
jgi:Glycosyl hydrolase family 9